MSFIIFFGPPNLIPKFKQASVLLIYRRDIKLLFSPCYVLIPSLQFCTSIIIINLPPFPHHLFYSRSPCSERGRGRTGSTGSWLCSCRCGATTARPQGAAAGSGWENMNVTPWKDIAVTALIYICLVVWLLLHCL